MVMFQYTVAEAKINCEVLHPKLQDKDFQINGKIEAEAKGFLSRIVGGKGTLDGEFENQDSLTKYKNSDQLAKWYSIVYISCELINESNLSTNQKIDAFQKMMNTYAILVGAEEKAKDPNYKNEYIPKTLNIEKYRVGRMPKDLGKNLLIKEFSTGEKYISGSNKNGFFEQKGINAKPRTEISFPIKLNFNNSDKREIILISDKNEKFVFKLRGKYLHYGAKKIRIWHTHYRWKYFYDREKNNFKFEIDNDLIIVSLNEKLVASISKKEGSTISSFIFRGLTNDGDGIYGFTVSKN